MRGCSTMEDEKGEKEDDREREEGGLSFCWLIERRG